ncbi:MAG: hypothetical protein GTO16_13035 [Candidatus Aminicenantes bacterium]|nr:hypothetical protein [Candidatus Aminicenantes bacterium]
MSNEIKIELNNFRHGRLARIHPAWLSFIKYCESLGYGEIEKLKIQNGLPMLAEEVKKKIKFSEKEWE